MNSSGMRNQTLKREKTHSKPKVFVGLSGGVDSAVSAALLKRRGDEVTGVFIKAWQPSDFAQGTRKNTCEWKEDRRSAMRAAAVLDIPFVTLDLEKEYKKGVVDYMIAEYKAGRTPNPDVMCNKEIKFGAFLNWALTQGADFVATGHYARTSPPTPLLDAGGRRNQRIGLSPFPLARGRVGSEVVLLEGLDKNKDQSYFLWTLTQNQLKHVLFPVGGMKKEDVRELAKKFGLPQATRKDSQGLCFLGQVDMKEFLLRYIDAKRGDVLNPEGEVIGYHDGAVFFTIGERHRFTITKKTAEAKALYVISKDIHKNTITVAPQITPHQSNSQWESLTLKDVNWISNSIPNSRLNLRCRLRYRQGKIPCSVEIGKDKDEIKVILKESHLISPGQSLVLYDNEVCLGGGIMQ